ncbi:hypothetical protein GNI_113420 [Gregarina niphandrodes]|uniref:Uncharacterized protein n=1 Tax=Gregarina niphandrodes TaxID=110365 RepID=A0A023B3B2_GRENI|nr:hypothetical protein GNI_113420 [Gregarina niphandrodes]EZG55400.1 hypothetical protein GNI_113420 [Gregarina niphandrodes]|eukprot:XP_011131574.1 hypothetical protein GNI_113420 [Gregarina niphandrodes]
MNKPSRGGFPGSNRSENGWIPTLSDQILVGDDYDEEDLVFGDDDDETRPNAHVRAESVHRGGVNNQSEERFFKSDVVPRKLVQRMRSFDRHGERIRNWSGESDESALLEGDILDGGVQPRVNRQSGRMEDGPFYAVGDDRLFHDSGLPGSRSIHIREGGLPVAQASVWADDMGERQGGDRWVDLQEAEAPSNVVPMMPDTIRGERMTPWGYATDVTPWSEPAADRKPSKSVSSVDKMFQQSSNTLKKVISTIMGGSGRASEPAPTANSAEQLAENLSDLQVSQTWSGIERYVEQQKQQLDDYLEQMAKVYSQPSKHHLSACHPQRPSLTPLFICATIRTISTHMWETVSGCTSISVGPKEARSREQEDAKLSEETKILDRVSALVKERLRDSISEAEVRWRKELEKETEMRKAAEAETEALLRKVASDKEAQEAAAERAAAEKAAAEKLIEEALSKKTSAEPVAAEAIPEGTGSGETDSGSPSGKLSGSSNPADETASNVDAMNNLKPVKSDVSSGTSTDPSRMVTIKEFIDSVVSSLQQVASRTEALQRRSLGDAGRRLVAANGLVDDSYYPTEDLYELKEYLYDLNEYVQDPRSPSIYNQDVYNQNAYGPIVYDRDALVEMPRYRAGQTVYHQYPENRFPGDGFLVDHSLLGQSLLDPSFVDNSLLDQPLVDQAHVAEPPVDQSSVVDEAAAHRKPDAQYPVGGLVEQQEMISDDRTKEVDAGSVIHVGAFSNEVPVVVHGGLVEGGLVEGGLVEGGLPEDYEPEMYPLDTVAAVLAGDTAATGADENVWAERPVVTLDGLLPTALDDVLRSTTGETILNEDGEWVIFQGVKPVTVEYENPREFQAQESKEVASVEWADMADEWGGIRNQLIGKIASSVEDVSKTVNNNPLSDIVKSLVEGLVESGPKQVPARPIETSSASLDGNSVKDQVAQNAANMLRQISNKVINSGPKFRPGATELDIQHPKQEPAKTVSTDDYYSSQRAARTRNWF